MLQKIKASGVTLNEEKCHFSQKSIEFLGNLIDDSGVHPDPEKVKAIVARKSPSNVTNVATILWNGPANEQLFTSFSR